MLEGSIGVALLVTWRLEPKLHRLLSTGISLLAERGRVIQPVLDRRTHP